MSALRFFRILGDSLSDRRGPIGMADLNTNAHDIQQSRLDYVRRVYSNVLDWYKSADTKAQVILTVNGLVITFLTSSILTAPETVQATFDSFGVETWVFLFAFTFGAVAALICAVLCLYSRLLSAKNLAQIFDQ